MSETEVGLSTTGSRTPPSQAGSPPPAAASAPNPAVSARTSLGRATTDLRSVALAMGIELTDFTSSIVNEGPGIAAVSVAGLHLWDELTATTAFVEWDSISSVDLGRGALRTFDGDLILLEAPRRHLGPVLELVQQPAFGPTIELGRGVAIDLREQITVQPFADGSNATTPSGESPTPTLDLRSPQPNDEVSHHGHSRRDESNQMWADQPGVGGSGHTEPPLGDAAVGDRPERDGDSDSVGTSMLITGMVGALELVAGLGVGVLTSRYLLATGRGEYSAISVWTTTAGVLGSFGMREAVVLSIGKRPSQRAQVIGTALCFLAVLCAITTGAVQLLLPIAFSEQTDEALALARIAGLAIFGGMLLVTLQGVLASLQRFRAMAVLSVLPSSILLVSIVLFRVTDLFGLRLVVLTKFGIVAALSTTGMAWALKTTGLGRPSLDIFRELASTGARVALYNAGQVGNGQLDMLVLPAFVQADQIGLYAVSVLAAGTLVTVTARLSTVVLPLVVAAERSDGLELLERVLRVVFTVALIGAVLMALLAHPIFEYVFGAEFTESVTPLLILLPGVVAWAVSTTACAGLQAFDLPGRSSWPQAVAVAVTAVGLVATLSEYGIRGAAATSSCAYITAMLVAITVLRREIGLRPGRIVRIHHIRDDARYLFAERSA